MFLLSTPLINPSCSREGDHLFQAKRFTAAKEAYLREAQKIVGASFMLPAMSGGKYGLHCDVYVKLNENPFELANLQGCCLGMAKCLFQENDVELVRIPCFSSASLLYRVLLRPSRGAKKSALCTGARIIDPSILYTVSCSIFFVFYLTSSTKDWRNWTLDVPEMTFLKSAGLCLASDIFASLGNSATATTRRWVATSTTVSLTAEHRTPALKSLLDMGLMIKLLESRHPDPQATLTGRVTVPALQARGSWTRLHIKNAGGFTEGRQNFSSFIWHSKCFLKYSLVSSINLDPPRLFVYCRRQEIRARTVLSRYLDVGS